MNKVDLRKEQLLLLLADRETLNVSEVSEKFNISAATARRLCNELARDGKVIRSHGAIERMETPDEGYDFHEAMRISRNEKKRIGQYAASIIKNSNNIFLESGSTVLECANSIAERVQNRQLKDLHVFTNFLPILEVLGNICEVSLIGGIYIPAKKCVRGYMSERALDNLHFDYCFIGCEAISIKTGIMSYDFDSIRFTEPLLSRTQFVVVVAQSEKFRKHSLVSYMPCNRARIIISDDSLTEEEAEPFLEQGIDLVRV
jgi:DeoR family fructose operon transcriptional repressor